MASIYAKEFTKIYVPPGDNMITIKADPLSGVFGKVDIILKFEKGKNYYFITGVNPKNVAGAFLGGMIGTAIAGGPFPTQQVTEELFTGVLEFKVSVVFVGLDIFWSKYA